MRPTLDPKLDVVFKLLFADERNRSCLTALLTALLKPADQRRLSEALELHILELPKLPQTPARAEDDPVLRWAKVFAAKNDDERERLAMTDPNLRQAKNALEHLSDDPRAQHLAFERQIELNSRERYVEIACEKAKAEGLKQGEGKGRAALVQAITLLCQGAQVELGAERRVALDFAPLDELGRILSGLAQSRAWPDAQ